MPPASESTVMILPPEPSRKSVNLLSAVSKVVSAPANAGPANQKEANRRAAITTIANSARPVRSEEHTSELQSLMRISYAVFCLNKTTVEHEQETGRQRDQTYEKTIGIDAESRMHMGGSEQAQA